MNVSRPTKGSIEAAIANMIVRFHHEQHGRGPENVKVHLIGDMVVARCNGIFTPIEARLSSSEEGRKLIVSARQELRSINHREIEDGIGAIMSCRVMYSYCTVNPDIGEQVEIYILDGDVDKRLLRDELDRLSGLSFDH